MHQSRQMRRASERAQAKVKTINATPLQACLLAALHPTLWRAAPAPEPAIAIDCNPPAQREAQPDHSSNAAGAGVEQTKLCDRCKKHKPLKEFSRRGGLREYGSPDGHCSTCKACTRPKAIEPLGKRPKVLEPEAPLILTRELIEQALEKAHEAEKAARLLRGAAGGDSEAKDKQPERKYTPSGWPINPFSGSASKISQQDQKA